jgi:putative Mg2+ transporter-C (MgtC) family protein
MGEITLRVGLAFLAGLLLGLERERHGRAAGMRTTALVATASAIAMIIPDQAILLDPHAHFDRYQIASGILTGMGFLGAGTIIKSGANVRGLSTAATLWIASVLGLAFGDGLLFLGMLGTGVAIFTLVALRYVETYFENDWYVKLAVLSELETPAEHVMQEQFKDQKIRIVSIDRHMNLLRKRRRIIFGIRICQCDELRLSKALIEKFSALPGVLAVNWR